MSYHYNLCEDHVMEYSYVQLRKILKDCGFQIIQLDGLFLSLKIAVKISKKQSTLFAFSKMGNLIPRLAHHLYLVAKKVNELN